MASQGTPSWQSKEHSQHKPKHQGPHSCLEVLALQSSLWAKAPVNLPCSWAGLSVGLQRLSPTWEEAVLLLRAPGQPLLQSPQLAVTWKSRCQLVDKREGRNSPSGA